MSNNLDKVLALNNKAYANGYMQGVEDAAKKFKVLCGVNPAKHRPCVDHVTDNFMCPICTIIRQLLETEKSK